MKVFLLHFPSLILEIIANYMFDLDKELDLQVFSNKHALTTDNHKGHKKKKKVKAAPAPDQEE
jgi:hypothetical protein